MISNVMEQIGRLESTFKILQNDLLKARKELDLLSLSIQRILQEEREKERTEKERENQIFGLLIRTKRLAKNLSLAEVAKMLGVHESHLSKIENGERKPSESLLVKLIQHLEITTENLSDSFPILEKMESKVRKYQQTYQKFLGKLLRSRRRLLGLTQKEVAQSVGCSQTYLSLIEKGDYSPQDSVLKKLLKVLQIPILFEDLKKIEVLRSLLKK